ncbi:MULTISPECIES: metallophosphoesterase [Caproicibacterium]|uniref:Metallophosphoesterase n=1 Tax=Caproicibacterium argilliputei TaxID=3030016 RepID=A0AA97H0X5_9FIRM|nr:metallophosphoesterase [Caproicibacterium argilliputei]WOC31020.1 metallophosphoesterase [Caproicibacterium argilliputei]
MALYAIADLHLSFGVEKPMDVFAGWENYTKRLEDNWRALVQPEDTVVIAGDISWAMKLQEAEADFRFLEQLPGRKLILKGNHDLWWSTRKKLETFLSDKGFSSISIVHNSAVRVGDQTVCGSRGWLYNAQTAADQKIVNREVGRLETSLREGEKLGGRPIVFLHYPPVYDMDCCEEILQVLEHHQITDCYFGHIHGNQAARRAVLGVYHGIRMHLVACDYLSFCPLLVRN